MRSVLLNHPYVPLKDKSVCMCGVMIADILYSEMLYFKGPTVCFHHSQPLVFLPITDSHLWEATLVQ